MELLLNMLIVPSRIDRSEVKESFESYYSRWPKELENVPEDVVRHWIYYHNECFLGFDGVYDLSKWVFKKERFSNVRILDVLHYPDELKHMDSIGERFLAGVLAGYDTADYMLKNGTFPCPIIVAHNAGEYRHHRGLEGESMLEPYHLIEGHRRLSFLRAMIKRNHKALKKEHDVWLVTIQG